MTNYGYPVPKSHEIHDLTFEGQRPPCDGIVRLRDCRKIYIDFTKDGLEIGADGIRIIRLDKTGKLNIAMGDGGGVGIGFPFFKRTKYADQFQLHLSEDPVEYEDENGVRHRFHQEEAEKK
jgi:hypothetical protein